MQPYYTVMKLPGERSAGVHADAAVHAAGERQPRGVDGGAQRRRALRAHARVPVPEAEDRLRPAGRSPARINQDQVISPQITLWNQQGSEVRWGTLLVIPIEESLLYVRPLYLRSPEGKIPELKRVIVAYQNQIVMAETLKLALVADFRSVDRPGARRPTASKAATTSVVPTPAEISASPPGPEDTAGELAAEAQTHWERAQQALREGDFARFGEEWKALGETLDKMRKIKSK